MTIAARLRAFESVLRHVRPLYRWSRTRYLRWRHPYGDYIDGTGLRVFADFRDDSYAWYDADAPNLSFDRRVVSALVAQSAGSVFIDVGAHFGFYSAIFADLSRGKRIKIIAAEPDRDNFRCLERTAALFEDVETVLLPVAVSDQDGSLSLYRSSVAPCLHSFVEEGSQPAYEVRSARLDTIVAQHVSAAERVAVIKVDVDGAEPFVLRSATETIEKHRPVVFIEFSPANLRSARVDPQAFFEDLCRRFRVYWVSYVANAVRPVRAEQYSAIEREVEASITDLVLSHEELDFGRLAQATQ